MSADARWLRAQAVAKLPKGNVLFVDADALVDGLMHERPDIHPILFSTRKDAWLDKPLPDLAGVCMGWHPTKLLTRMLLQMLAEKLPVGTKLWLFGGGRSGISSAASVLAEHWHKIEKVGFGGHSELWHAVLAEPVADYKRGLECWQEKTIHSVAGQELVLITYPGVFSYGDVDEGTRLLLEHLPLLPRGARVHDFGCGGGVITAWLKLRQPDVVVSASDISALAFTATKATLKANQLTDIVLHAEGGMGKIPGTFDAIISNPPFHSGQSTDYSITDELFKSAAKKLKVGGTLTIVGNRFLPYRAPMEKLIGSTQVLAETKSFWVLSARKA
jgi:16S rRNA (guanine1207-N2)-methyltransferase